MDERVVVKELDLLEKWNFHYSLKNEIEVLGETLSRNILLLEHFEYRFQISAEDHEVTLISKDWPNHVIALKDKQFGIVETDKSNLKLVPGTNSFKVWLLVPFVDL